MLLSGFWFSQLVGLRNTAPRLDARVFGGSERAEMDAGLQCLRSLPGWG